MIRDRLFRALSLLVLVAGCAAIVGAAGAGWNFAPAHDQPRVRVNAVPSTPTTTADSESSLIPRPPATKPAPPQLPTDLPRSLPASVLPAGTRLPVRAALPSDPWAARQPTRLGQFVIPSIGLSQPLFEGVDQAAFAHGVGHWPGTAGPGAWGNAVFGGHRVTESHPFLNLERIRLGDEIQIQAASGWTYVYRVTKVFVVPQSAMWIADQKPGRTLTIFTCHPKGSATERLVTNAVLSRVVAAT